MIFGYQNAFGFNSSRMYECAVAGFCAAGIPLILITLVGVARKVEATVRLYFLYMSISICLDTVYVARRFLLESTCDYLPKEMALHGSAFACGMVRGTDAIAITALTLIQGYLMFVVWSYCEDLATGGSSGGFQELHLHKEELQKRLMHQQDGYNTGIMKAQAEWDDLDASGYGSIEECMDGFGGSQRILGGSYHDMSFPPQRI